MEDIFSLLDINKSVLDAFKHQANLIDDRPLEKTVALNLKKLKLIQDSMLSGNGIKASDRSIEIVLDRVRKESKIRPLISDWSFRDLRLVSYYLTLLHGDEKAYDYALYLLNNHWRSLYFNGLVFYLMNGWLNIPSSYKEKTCRFLQQKLSDYHETNKRYLLFKDHANFFDLGGPFRLAALVKAKNEDIRNAPIFLGFKPASLTLPFYSEVIVNYLKDYSVDSIPEIESIFEIHDLDRTKKLVLANLVKIVNENGNELQQTVVGKFSQKILGDITLASTWAPFQGATEEECKKLSEARSLVNAWTARKVVDVFFERCVQDPNRKEFWINYIPYLSDFRIVGSLAVRGLVDADQRLEGLVDKFFVQSKSLKSQTAALVFKIKNKILVEFSDLGSLYVYNEGFQPCELVFTQQEIASTINSLKMPNYGRLVDFVSTSAETYNRQTRRWERSDQSTYYAEGRLPHNVGWQLRVYAWIKAVLKVNLDIEEYEKQLPSFTSIEPQDRFSLMSKEMSNGCRVVLREGNFLLFSSISGETVFLRYLNYGEPHYGNIWLKNGPGEQLIAVHAFDDVERPIANLIPQPRYVSIKRDWDNIFDQKFYVY